MDDSPLVSPMIKEYIIKFKLEALLNEAVNEVLRQLPDDPFSMMCSIIKNKSLSVYKINSMIVKKVYLNDFKQFAQLEIVMTYKGNMRKTISYIIPFLPKTYEILNGTMDPLLKLFQAHYVSLVNDCTIEQFSTFDKMIAGVYEDISPNDTTTKALMKALSNAISVASFLSMPIIMECPAVNFFRDSLSEFVLDGNIPNLGFSIFKAGKSMNSKIKYERFIIFVNNSSRMSSEELLVIFNKLYFAIRKFLTAGKLGENGMRLNNEGSYFPPNDTLNDAVKQIEEMIKETAEHGKLYYGIDCNANNYFNPSTKLYEMDGFKKPPDADPLIDFYIKFCTDHPLCCYLEDPIADADMAGWSKIYAKISSTKLNVTISSKSLVGESVKMYQHLTEMKEIIPVGDLLPEEEKIKIIEENKKISEENSKKLPLTHISVRIGEFSSISEIFKITQSIKGNINFKTGISLWDNGVESDQSSIIDLGLGLRVSNIILHGFTNKNDRMSKINRYLETIEQLY